jgi:hypothetical protein
MDYKINLGLSYDYVRNLYKILGVDYVGGDKRVSARYNIVKRSVVMYLLHLGYRVEDVAVVMGCSKTSVYMSSYKFIGTRNTSHYYNDCVKRLYSYLLMHNQYNPELKYRYIHMKDMPAFLASLDIDLKALRTCLRYRRISRNSYVSELSEYVLCLLDLYVSVHLYMDSGYSIYEISKLMNLNVSALLKKLSSIEKEIEDHLIHKHKSAKMDKLNSLYV